MPSEYELIPALLHSHTIHVKMSSGLFTRFTDYPSTGTLIGDSEIVRRHGPCTHIKYTNALLRVGICPPNNLFRSSPPPPSRPVPVPVPVPVPHMDLTLDEQDQEEAEYLVQELRDMEDLNQELHDMEDLRQELETLEEDMKSPRDAIKGVCETRTVRFNYPTSPDNVDWLNTPTNPLTIPAIFFAEDLDEVHQEETAHSFFHTRPVGHIGGWGFSGVTTTQLE